MKESLLYVFACAVVILFMLLIGVIISPLAAIFQ